MPRTIDPAAHALRRDAFVDSAQRLIQTRGYEQFSIEDLLDEVGASKGAFYHYFDGKPALLQAIVERMAATGVARWRRRDGSQPASGAKLGRYFATIAALKAERRTSSSRCCALVLPMTTRSCARSCGARASPGHAPIRSDRPPGHRRGHLHTADPEQMARIVLALISAAGDEVGELYIRHDSGEVDLDIARRHSGRMKSPSRGSWASPQAPGSLIDDETLRCGSSSPQRAPPTHPAGRPIPPRLGHSNQ